MASLPNPELNTHEYDVKSLVMPLDASLYQPDATEVQFFSAQTGLHDPKELKQHILAVQKEAYAVHPYPCIRLFSFAKLKISRLPAYNQLLQLGRGRPGALFLDVGCCVGNDTRKPIADGFPADQVIATDLHAEFWDVGHKLFKSTPETCPVAFVPGDALDPAFLAPAPIPTHPPSDQEAPLDLRSLTTLVPLVGRLSAIYTASFFHLFDEPTQLALARRLAALLLPQPGSLIFGMHVAAPEKGLVAEAYRPGAPPMRMFCHSPASWRAMWETEVFVPGTVRVEVLMRTVPKVGLSVGDGRDGVFHLLVWSVTRV